MCQQAGWCIQGKRVIPSNLFILAQCLVPLTLPSHVYQSTQLLAGCCQKAVKRYFYYLLLIIQKQQGQEVGIAEIKNTKLGWFSRPNASLVYSSVRNKKKREKVLYKIYYIWERLQDLDHGLYLVLDWKFEKRAKSLQG